MAKKLTILCPYPTSYAPSQRFRFEQYISILQKEGFTVHCKPFVDHLDYLALYHKGGIIKKVFILGKGFLKRLLNFQQYLQSDFIFIHREATPVGPPVIEWLIANVLKSKIIFDFDDAIWLTDQVGETWWQKIVRNRSKTAKICKWSYKISCGNDYLASYARQFNANVVINPTTIDTESLHSPFLYSSTNKKGITIGWTGSHSTIKYLELIAPALKIIEQKYPSIHFLFIADKEPMLDLKNSEFKKWKKETEIEDLLQIDIGIMPLPDDEWTKGKCGFKALQYMALGKPSVVSPVGVNTKIIQSGINGSFASNQQEWIDCLSELMDNERLRTSFGTNARKMVEQHYSVLSNTFNFLSLFI